MRRILLITGMMGSLSVAAQNNDLVENYFDHKSKLRKDAVELSVPPDCYHPKEVFKTIMPSRWGTTLNGEKIYQLPQDGMACIIPDTEHFNMPNAGEGILLKKYGAGTIPNPGVKNKIVQEQLVHPKRSR